MLSNNKTTLSLRMSVYCALFTALIIGSYISMPIPIGPIPIVLAGFFVMLAGLFIGGKHGLLSVGLYLSLGALGIPIFFRWNFRFCYSFRTNGWFFIWISSPSCHDWFHNK